MDTLGYKERTLDRSVDTLKTEKAMVLWDASKNVPSGWLLRGEAYLEEQGP